MNLLDDPVFTVETSTGHEMCSLPRIYHLLQQDAVEGFAKLQAHQKQAWHCFLAQLGAIATENCDLPQTKGGWREALAALTVPEAWNLYTEDLNKPAFMQPPVPEGTLDGWDKIHPSEYDVPVLSKSHALKIRRVQKTTPEHWVYLSINVQTSIGVMGRSNYNASRMNKGTSSRPFFGLTPSLRLGKWIMHDINKIRTYVQEIEDRHHYSREVNPLLWTVPWDGSKESVIEFGSLHPLYIDYARRWRNSGDGWYRTTTNARRITGQVRGQTGDPWAPVDTSGRKDKVLNPSRRDLEYRRFSKIIFGADYRGPISFRGVTKGYIVCRVLTGGQGKREYLLERTIPFTTEQSVNPFSDEQDTSIIQIEAVNRVQKAEEAERIFSHALGWLLCEDAEEGTSSGIPDALMNARNRQVNALHARIDQRFFDRLFEAPDMDDKERLTFWETILVEALQTQFREAKELCPNKHRWKRLAKAQSVFDNRAGAAFTYANQFDNESAYV